MFDCRRDISSISHMDVSPVSPFAVLSFSLADEILQKYRMQTEGYYPFGTMTFLEESETEESENTPKEQHPENRNINFNLELFLMLSDPSVTAEEKNKLLSFSDKEGRLYGGQGIRIIERAAALRKAQYKRRSAVRIRQKLPVPYVPITKASSSLGKGDISKIKYPAMVFSEVIDKAQNAGVTFGGSGPGKVPVPVYIKDFEKNSKPYDLWEEMPEDAELPEKASADNTDIDVPEVITDTADGIPVFDTVTESILPGAEIIHVKDNAESAEEQDGQISSGKTGRVFGKMVGDLFGNLASLIRIEARGGKASQHKASERSFQAEKDIRQEGHQKRDIRTAAAGKRAAGPTVTADSAGNKPIRSETATVVGNKPIKSGDVTVIGDKAIKSGDVTVIGDKAIKSGEAADSAGNKPIKPGDATVIESRMIKPGDATVIESKTINPGDLIIVGNKTITSDAATVIEDLKGKPEDTESIVENPSEVLTEEKQEIQEKQESVSEGLLPGAEIIYVKENAEAAEAENSLTPSGNADRYIKELTEDVVSLIQREPLGSKALQTGKTAGSFGVDKKEHTLSVPGAEIIYAEDGTEIMKVSEEAEGSKAPAAAGRIFEKLAERISEERILPELRKQTEQKPGQKPEEHLSTGQKPESAISERTILKSMIPEGTNPERIPESAVPGAEIIYEKEKGSPEERVAERPQAERESISILTRSLVNTVAGTAGMRFLREEIGRSSIRTGRTAGIMAANAVRSMAVPASAAGYYTDSFTGGRLSGITVSPIITGDERPLVFENAAYSPYGAVNIEYADTVANISREIQNAVNAGSFGRPNGEGFVDPGNFGDTFDPFESSGTASFAEEVRKELLTQGPSVTYQNPYFMGAGSDMTHRERHKDSEQTSANQVQRQPQPVRISDAELRRSADKIFNMIKDKVKLERRSMGLS